MSSSDVALRVTGLRKAYTIRHGGETHITLAEQVLSRLRHPLRKTPSETFWALQGIDLEVRRGEVLGVIGGNGAGKSTLLKILSRITAPTEGRIELFGRIGSLLEVGTGFHSELTGRENIYLNGTILGMKKAEIDRRFDEIVDFAGVERFLDTPVKRYSSGMYVRLAFAVAAHMQTEILLLDEVLAVADVAFQERSLGKMREVAQSGRTVLLVSHQLGVVQALASRILLLQDGQVKALASPERAIEMYTALRMERSGREAISDNKRWDTSLPRTIEVTSISAVQENVAFGSNEPIRFVVCLKFNERPPEFRLSLTVATLSGTPIASGFSSLVQTPPEGSGEYVVTIPSHHLAPGNYSLSLAVGRGNNMVGMEEFDIIIDGFAFEINPLVGENGAVGAWTVSWGSVVLSGISLCSVDVAGD